MKKNIFFLFTFLNIDVTEGNCCVRTFKSNCNQVLINEAQYQLMRECFNHFRITSSITEYCRNKNEMTR